MIKENKLRLIGMRMYYVYGELSRVRAVQTAKFDNEQILCERYNIDGD